MIVSGRIEGIGSKLLLDTESDTNLMFRSQTKKLGLLVHRSNMWIKGLGKEPTKCLRKIGAWIQIGSVKKQVTFDVMLGSGQTILGNPDIAKMKLVLDLSQACVYCKATDTMVRCLSMETKPQTAYVGISISKSSKGRFSHPGSTTICRY